MNIKKYLINITQPFSRFLARALDYTFFYCFFILPLFFASLLDHDSIHALCVIAIPLLWIPFEALFTAFLGTTPGKALLGIHIRNNKQKKLSLKDSFKRAISIWTKGLGCNLPILNIFLACHRFNQIKDKGTTPWDAHNGIQIYHKRRRTLRTTLASILMAFFSLFFVVEYEVREVATSSGQDFFSHQLFKRDHLNWTTYQDPDGSYSIDFPGRPEASSTKLPIPRSKEALPFHSVNCLINNKKVEYNLTYTILPTSWLKWSSGLLLKGALKIVASHVSKAKILKKSSKSYRNYPAIEFVMKKSNNQQCAGRLVLIGNVLYKIDVSYPEELEQEVQEELNAFLQSFEPK